MLSDSREIRSLLHDTTLLFAAIPSAASDQHGRVYIADLGQHALVRVDTRAGIWLRIGRQGKGPGEFESPLVVATGGNGQILSYDITLGRVSKFDSLGTLLNDFSLPFQLFNAWSMIVDDSGSIYISGTSTSMPQAEFVIHKLSSSGAWIQSFCEASVRFPTFLDRLYGDGGLLWWDDEEGAVWFSRGGPVFELSAFGRTGELRHRLTLREGRLQSWRPLMRESFKNGMRQVSPGTRLGTIALVSLPGPFLVNVTMVDDSGTMRYDAIRLRDRVLVARWSEKHRYPMAYIGLGDGREWVYEFTPRSQEGPIRHSVSFQDRSKE